MEKTSGNSWDTNYMVAKEFFNKNNHLLVPTSYVTNDNIPLGLWIQRQRHRYQCSNENSLCYEQIKALEDIGMIWDVAAYNWNIRYNFAKEYYKQNKNLLIPYEYKIQIPNGKPLNLGIWIHTQRKAYKGQSNCKITYEQIKALEDIGMIWDVKKHKWNKNFNLLKKYYQKHKNTQLPSEYIIDNEDVGYWLWEQQRLYAKNSLSEEKVIALMSIGVELNK